MKNANKPFEGDRDFIAKASRQEKRFPNYHSMSLRVYQLIERKGCRNVGMGMLLRTCDRGATYNFLCVHLRVITDIHRGFTELVQVFAYKGSLHRRKGAARHIIYMVVLLYRSPIPVGRRGIFYLFRWFLPAFAAPGGGEGQHQRRSVS
jgi:hypothetical protein